MDSLIVGQPFTFPCGATIKNRMVKSAMAEGYMTKDLLPPADYDKNYGRWAQGGWGMVISGNIMVDPKGVSGPGCFLLDNPRYSRSKVLERFKSFGIAARQNNTTILAQLVHPGRAGFIGSGTKTLFEKNKAPSAVPEYIGPTLLDRAMAALFFGTPAEMTKEEINNIIDKFVNAAKLIAEAGLDGVELHGAHGYLITQFLSGESNLRTDEYGGDALGRTTFVTKLIKAVREAVPKGFIVGIKLNSVDFQTDRKGGREMDKEKQLRECIAQFGAIANAGVDFVEVSGGSMAEPSMTNGLPKSARTQTREAFFLSFAETFRKSFPDVPLVVTGGFHSRIGMESAISSEATDLVGVGRASVLHPSLPSEVILNPEIPDKEAWVEVERHFPPKWFSIFPKMFAVGYENNVYGGKIQQLGLEEEGAKK